MRRTLSPKAAREYDKISEEEDQISEDLDCLKKLFVSSGRENDNLVSRLQQQ